MATTPLYLVSQVIVVSSALRRVLIIDMEGGKCHRRSAAGGARLLPVGHYFGREMPIFFIQVRISALALVRDGPDDPEVERLRNRQVKNFLTLTLLSVGTPMLLSGDEVRRSQSGNNNAYCQDNETSWFDWSLLEKHADVLRFTRHLIALRLNPDIPFESINVTLSELLRHQPVQWHGVKLDAPDWRDLSHSLAASVRITDGFELHLMVNAYWEELVFDVPPAQRDDAPWRLIIDTFRESPDDIRNWRDAPALEVNSCVVQPRSIVLLIGKAENAPNPPQG